MGKQTKDPVEKLGKYAAYVGGGYLAYKAGAIALGFVGFVLTTGLVVGSVAAAAGGGLYLYKRFTRDPADPRDQGRSRRRLRG